MELKKSEIKYFKLSSILFLIFFGIAAYIAWINYSWSGVLFWFSAGIFGFVLNANSTFSLKEAFERFFYFLEKPKNSEKKIIQNTPLHDRFYKTIFLIGLVQFIFVLAYLLFNRY